MLRTYEKLEEALCYRFQDPSLLRNALTHSSYANENRNLNLLCNERLEFLGDSVLGFAVADFLYRNFPDRPEGGMTRMGADMVCETTLAQAAQSIGLGEVLLLGHGEAQGGGRKRASILADAMESVIAAAYLDGGYEAACGIVKRLILCAVPVEQMHNVDYKSALQELAQQTGQMIAYQPAGESGPDHNKHFWMEVLINDTVVGQGEGTSKKRAAQAAAKMALEKLGK